MNRIALSFITLVLLIFAACDIVEPPYMTDRDIDNGDTTEVVRKVLLEEFTGHQCPNCPDGTKMAEELKAYYGDQLIIMSVHAGWFARPLDGTFSNDYRTEEGEALNDFFGCINYPIGMVNRTDYENSRLLGYSAWGGAIQAITELPPAYIIELELDDTPDNAGLDISVDVTSLINCINEYHLSVFIIEDGIISPQRTNDPDYTTGIIEDYEHNHMLRKGVNGTWGEVLNDDNFAFGDTFSKQYQITLDDEWVPENCSVIAFVYRTDNLEIHQVEIAPLF
jgi:hypothetical protein